MTTSIHITRHVASHRQPIRRTWPCAPFPVRTGRDYKQALAILDQLVPLDRPTREERDFMDIMLPVIETYETERQLGLDTSKMTPLDLLRSLMQDHGMSAADLGRILGNRSLGSAILRGDRELSKANIKTLANYFKVSPAALI